MTEIPESLLRRSAEAKAKALGLPVEQVLAEMKGEAPPTPPPSAEPSPEVAPSAEAEVAGEVDAAAERAEEIEDAIESVEEEPEPVEEIPGEEEGAAEEPEVEVTAEPEVFPAPPTEAPPPSADAPSAEAPAEGGDILEPEPAPSADGPPAGEGDVMEPAAAAVATAVEDKPTPAGNGKVASSVSPRPTVPPKGTPEGVRTQRLLTVVKARAIQTVKAEPTDKVNTWPHLMLMEFGALLALTGLLVIMSVIIHSPLLDPANFNATPNPSKAPWYFLGLQELLSYFDPQIAGVMVPTITGIIGFMMVPYVDKNPSTRPSDRKFAIALYSVFLAGAATLTIIGVLFRGRGFNFSYPWKDGVFFDDLKDWVHFE
jgi:menaquinol-cytochrome c reductase cytochrome b/c subunit